LPTKKKKTFVFHLQKTNRSMPCNFSIAANKRKLPFSISSVFRIYIYTACIWTVAYIFIDIGIDAKYIYVSISIYLYIHTSIYVYTFIYICCLSNGKRKTKFVLNPFTVCWSCKRKFIRLLTKKQTEVIRL
jgi:hypothetical protein